jgi:hypothetical protein
MGVLGEIDMIDMRARSAGFGFAVLAVTVLGLGFSGNTFAKHKRHLHVYSHASVGDANAELVAPAQPGAMRYYGGPKSPMWRGPAAN